MENAGNVFKLKQFKKLFNFLVKSIIDLWRLFMTKSKKIVWYNLAFMAFSTVWGFGNVVNGFVYFNGIQVIFSWILMFALYFVL